MKKLKNSTKMQKKTKMEEDKTKAAINEDKMASPCPHPSQRHNWVWEEFPAPRFPCQSGGVRDDHGLVMPGLDRMTQWHLSDRIHIHIISRFISKGDASIELCHPATMCEGFCSMNIKCPVYHNVHLYGWHWVGIEWLVSNG